MSTTSHSKGGNTLAIATVATVKRAALLFDKVFLIQALTGTESDIEDACDRFEWVKGSITLAAEPPFNDPQARSAILPLGELAEKIYELESERFRDYDLVPIYGSEVDLRPDFHDGKTLAYLAAIHSIPQALEKEITWEQIGDFRKDQDARRKYRALRTWLRDGLKARSVAEADVV